SSAAVRPHRPRAWPVRPLRSAVSRRRVVVAGGRHPAWQGHLAGGGGRHVRVSCRLVSGGPRRISRAARSPASGYAGRLRGGRGRTWTGAGAVPLRRAGVGGVGTTRRDGRAGLPPLFAQSERAV